MSFPVANMDSDTRFLSGCGTGNFNSSWSVVVVVIVVVVVVVIIIIVVVVIIVVDIIIKIIIVVVAAAAAAAAVLVLLVVKPYLKVYVILHPQMWGSDGHEAPGLQARDAVVDLAVELSDGWVVGV